MKNVEFKNDDVKKIYELIVQKHRSLASIISKLIKNEKPIKIMETKELDNGVMLFIQRNEQGITIEIDNSSKKIYLEKSDKFYKEIYDDLPMKVMKPIGYLYKKDEREITKKLLFENISGKEKVRHYILNENGKHYSIILNIKNTVYDEEETIMKFLFRHSKYNSIRELLLAVMEFIDISHVDVSLGDSMGSNVAIKDGTIKTYVEYQEKENYKYDIITMEDGNFYIDKRVKEDYQDNFTLYVKKIGEYNGKEKRKN